MTASSTTPPARAPRLLAVVAALLAIATAAACGGSGKSADTEDGAAPPGVSTLLSRPDLRPPKVFVDQLAGEPGSRTIFMSPRMAEPARDADTHQQGALAVDERGRTVWFGPVADGEPVTDVRVQRYEGRPVLTWWQGAANKFGVGRGEGVIADTSYRTIATVQAGNRHTIDLHEFLLTDRGTALVTIYSRARRDLRSIGGLEDAQVTEGIIQEIDVETGKVLFEWHSLDEIDPSESYRVPTLDPDESFDYFHINSIDEDENGDLLVSARHTSGVYKIDRETGRVVWRLGGKRSDFRMGEGTVFGFQHDARWLADGRMQVFDNVVEAEEGEQRASTVMRIRLDERAMTARLTDSFDQPDGLWAESQGNAQALDDGGVMVGWGSTGSFSLLGPDGTVRLDAHLPVEYDSYRAYIDRWTGRPAVPPAVHVAREKEKVTVSASWNGSTEVRAWQVLAGPSAQALEPIGSPALWRDLETTIVRATEEPYVAVAALGEDGETLGTSGAVRVGAPPAG